MDDPTFDRLTKLFAGGITRRRVARLACLGGSALAGLLGRRTMPAPLASRCAAHRAAADVCVN